MVSDIELACEEFAGALVLFNATIVCDVTDVLLFF